MVQTIDFFSSLINKNWFKFWKVRSQPRISTIWIMDLNQTKDGACEFYKGRVKICWIPGSGPSTGRGCRPREKRERRLLFERNERDEDIFSRIKGGRRLFRQHFPENLVLGTRSQKNDTYKKYTFFFTLRSKMSGMRFEWWSVMIHHMIYSWNTNNMILSHQASHWKNTSKFKVPLS